METRTAPLLSLVFSDNDREAEMPESLPPEDAEGNIEYKLKLINPTRTRFEHLVTQMKWRLQEGHGEAIYEIGVEDSGLLAGLTAAEMSLSLKTLDRMAEKLGATVTPLRVRQIEMENSENGEPVEVKHASELLVRKVPDDQQFIELRVAVLGNADAGKSTLLGTLTHGRLDNGRGRARLNVFRHPHEIQSGRTSSVSHEILGFDSTGQVINYTESRRAEDICENSTKLITFVDLAGHQKYLHTTISGLTAYAPDFVMLVVSANTGIAGTTKEHLGLALALQVPIFVMVSKIDLCSASVIERTTQQLERVLKSPGCKKVPFRIHGRDDAITAASCFTGENYCTAPIFFTSSVTGENLDLLTTFLNVLPQFSSLKEREQKIQDHPEFQIDSMFKLQGTGTVVGGTLVRGVVCEGSKLLLGPTDAGEFELVQVRSLHRNRAPCRVVRAGQAATLALADSDNIVTRKGMVLVSPSLSPSSCWEFDAEVYILYHFTAISKNSQATVYCGNVRQTAVISSMDKELLHTNERATVRFRFMRQPEYLQVGSCLVFRDGRNKGIGKICKVCESSVTKSASAVSDAGGAGVGAGRSEVRKVGAEVGKLKTFIGKFGPGVGKLKTQVDEVESIDKTQTRLG
ncbi:PREDICTED: GTP-binding protein 2-like isoform X2 [Priapulus caudatus]|uniref:GTP-binding protein 2-like isoform X2 n=1 Tax=Priapulus caudatus TaxID=37621 RepID=A0ABM1ENI1_PRICU|nr:PREDICTED: GTP-binding protein 2-like isoform X2 [Priapulus caudatus]